MKKIPKNVVYAAEGEIGETPVFIVANVPLNQAYASENASGIITHP